MKQIKSAKELINGNKYLIVKKDGSLKIKAIFWESLNPAALEDPVPGTLIPQNMPFATFDGVAEIDENGNKEVFETPERNELFEKLTKEYKAKIYEGWGTEND